MENFQELFCSLFSEFLIKIENAGISCGEFEADCLTIQELAKRGYSNEELAEQLNLSHFELSRALDKLEWLEKLLK